MFRHVPNVFQIEQKLRTEIYVRFSSHLVCNSLDIYRRERTVSNKNCREMKHMHCVDFSRMSCEFSYNKPVGILLRFHNMREL
jgi:hypothetical protein